MFRERDFGGVDIDITVPVTNMEETGYGTKAQSLDVIGGVWVNNKLYILIILARALETCLNSGEAATLILTSRDKPQSSLIFSLAAP